MALHKVPKSLWVSCPILFYGLVGIGAYARTASEGGTYHPVCTWPASGRWIPRTLRVVKVGVKVSLKQPSSATGPSIFGSMSLGAGQVKTETWTNSQVGLSILCCGTKFTLPYHMPTKQDTNPHSNNGQVKPVKDNNKVACATISSSATVPSSCASAVPLSFYGTSFKGTKGGPSYASIRSGPHVTRCPTSSI